MEFNIQILKTGDANVFRKIVNAYWRRLNKFAQIYTRDDEVAKELVQDTFLSLWDKRESLKDDTKLIPYLMVVLRNKCINHLKQVKIETESIDNIETEAVYKITNLLVLEDEVSTILDTDDLYKIIKDAIALLPEKTRMIFQLSRKEHLSNKEISEKLNISIKTVEFHITKTLQHLRKHLPKD